MFNVALKTMLPLIKKAIPDLKEKATKYLKENNVGFFVHEHEGELFAIPCTVEIVNDQYILQQKEIEINGEKCNALDIEQLLINLLENI